MKTNSSASSLEIVIEGTISVLNFRTRGMGMVFRRWAHERTPLNSQWPVLEKVAPISTIVSLLILCSKNVLGL